jgi:demethylmenaquinone methyltransferase/2-methoxy-6-polyprenyl-1,4-benzoquinol methylase
MDNLKTKFGKRKVNEKDKTSLVQSVFSEVSQKYDLMNDFMSLGNHRIWKKNLIDLMNIQNNDIIIDVGSGTGDLIDLMIKKKKFIHAYSLDLNKKMLIHGQKKILKDKITNVNFINANAENIPFNNDFFDKYVISFCLRNITYINKALDESYRILKPGGVFYCLEFSSPSSNLVKWIYSNYKSKIIPYLGKKIAKNHGAYKYLEESISQFPNQDTLLNQLNKVGFVNSSYINLFNGIVCIHKGYKA